MKNRHLGRYDKSGVEKLYKLFSNEMATKDAAAILGVSTTSVQAYYKIFNDLHAGKIIETSKHNYCESAVKAFCEAHGFTYRHISDEQPPEAVTEAPAEAAQLPGQIGMDEAAKNVAETAEERAEAPRAVEPERIAAARENMARAISRYVLLLIDEYMKAVNA